MNEDEKRGILKHEARSTYPATRGRKGEKRVKRKEIHVGKVERG